MARTISSAQLPATITVPSDEVQKLWCAVAGTRAGPDATDACGCVRAPSGAGLPVLAGWVAGAWPAAEAGEIPVRGPVRGAAGKPATLGAGAREPVFAAGARRAAWPVV